MRKQAKYLIDNEQFFGAGTASSWDYDNRYESSLGTPFPETLVNHAVGGRISVKRDFQPQKGGILFLELFYITEKSGDGAFIRMEDVNGNVIFEYRTENGYYVFNETITDALSEAGKVRTKVTLDLDAKTAKFAIDGKTVGTYPIGDVDAASRLFIGTTGDADISLTPKHIRLYADYIANEIFTGASKYIPDDWKIEGKWQIEENERGMNYNFIKAELDAGEKATAFRPIKRTEGNTAFEGYFLLPEGADGLHFSVCDGEKEAFSVRTENCEFKTANGDFLRKFTPNVWQVLRFETNGNEITVKIDGKKCGTFSSLSSEFDGIKIVFAPAEKAKLCFADIMCESIIDYPDYCPVPKKVRHNDYEIGMNMCSLWREGHHFGWDKITHFKENVPLIGPYDEGLTEVADWEIKFMTEHGITFQHYCWYCPDAYIDRPLKRSRMDNALRDGFMNARYSDMMKFVIMWENASYNNPSVEEFKEYIWKYWCDYFFTDKRYLVIDNKPLLSIWCERFKEYWGVETTKEVLAFMNEDIKRYGFDGIWLMTATWVRNNERNGEFFDAGYAYHYLEAGCSEDFQIWATDKFIEDHEKRGAATFVKSICSGYNTCAWHGAEGRCKLISMEGYEKVLRHAKAHADNCDGKNPLDKIFMISTWNEYGEGTYVMPSNIHGFEYLDKVREVFVPESGKCENLLPDDNQRKRISYLTVPNRRLIRRHGFEAPNSFSFADDDVVKSWDFTNGKNYDEIKPGVSTKFTVLDHSALLSPDGNHEHYSVHIIDENGICRAEDATHIRIRVKTDMVAMMRVAFLTKTDKQWAGNKCENFLQCVANNDEYADYLCNIKRSVGWKGVITELRIDNMIKSGCEIEKIELLNFRPELHNVPMIAINGNKLTTDFLPIIENGHFIVSFDQGRCAFRALKLYHEFNGATEELMMETLKDKVVYTVGSDEAIKNGERIKLSVPLTMRDGLPTLAIDELCDILGIKYTVDGNKFMIEV